MSRSRSRPASSKKSQKRSVALFLTLWFGASLLGLGLFAVLRDGSGSTYVPEVTGAPRLEVDREKLDLGDVRLGREVTASFTLANVGDQPLRFTREPYVKVAAGC